MKVLIACEFSGIVREAFRKRGHDAWSCDYLDTEIPGNHYQGPVEMGTLDLGWDLMIAHPPCTYLANSGVQHLHKDKSRWDKLKEAEKFFMILLNAPIPKIAIENPIPHGYAKIPKYHQIIHPWMFGEDAQKKTCLWLKKLPPLMGTIIAGKGERYIDKNGKKNGSKWYQLAPSSDRWKHRSRTFQGIANAMAEQWG